MNGLGGIFLETPHLYFQNWNTTDNYPVQPPFTEVVSAVTAKAFGYIFG